MVKHYAYLLFFMLFTTFATASNGSLKGVVSSNNEWLSDALIAINKTNFKTLTDTFGKFEINNIPNGNYTITISKTGYFEQTSVVKISNETTTEIIIVLTPNILELKNVLLSTQATNKAIDLNKLDRQLRPVSSSQDLLRLVPGLFIAQHAGGGKAEQIFLRGFDIDHGTDFAITVDGIPVNMPSHAHGQGYADLHFLIPETVKELEVNKGPHTTRYGDLATAGSGEFKTLSRLDKNIIKAEYGSYDTRRLLAMFNLLDKKHFLSSKNENLYIAGEYRFTNSYFIAKQNFTRVNLFTKYTGILNNGDKLNITLSTFKSQWDASGQIPDRKVEDGSISRFGSIDPTEGGNTDRTNFNLQHERKRGNKLYKNQLYYSRYNFNLFSNFTFFLHDSINGDQIFQSDHRHLAGYNSSLQINHFVADRQLVSTFGSGFRYDHADIQLNHTVKRQFINTIVNGTLNQLNTWFYADEVYAVTDHLKINTGVRADIYNFNFKNQTIDSVSGNVVKAIVSPKINLIYTPNNKLQLFIKSGYGFHSNDARAVIVGKLDNTLARAFGNEISALIKTNKKLLLNVAIWHMDLQSELVYVGDEGIVEATGRTRRVGIDLGARWQLTKHLFIDADINLNEGWLRDAPKDANRIPLAPKFTSIGGVTYKSDNGLNGSIRYRYMGNRAAIEDNTIIAQGYFLTDAVLNYNYKNYQLGFTFENIFNIKWKEAQFATESRLKDEMNAINEIHFTPGSPRLIKLIAAYRF
ncbi:MAG: TonB-dependent receptor [Bacteroidota bacterium]